MEFVEDFIEKFLLLHNEYRAIHHSPPLVIDDRLGNSAQEWADTLADNNVLEYKSDPEYGENIFVAPTGIQTDGISPNDPLEAWYREARYFKYGEEDVADLEYVQNFTQLVWKETKTIGIGVSAPDDDGKIYVVCLYKPPGNVAGGFAENVLAPDVVDSELEQHEAEGIAVGEAKMDVVKSMERIYAVPSEKLRVWLIWISKVGEIADEWQRWLRAHIDLALRLSEQLKAAEEALRPKKEGEDQLAEVAGEPEEEVEILYEAADTDLKGEGSVPALETEAEWHEAVEEHDESAVTPTTETAETESAVPESAEAESAVPESAEAESAVPENAEAESAEPERAETERAETEGDEKVWQSVWPLGTPWEHRHGGIIEETDDRPPFEQLPLPSNKDDMKQFLRKFTHEATVYRSYYWHWKETTDKAINEVGNRSVLATYAVQGKDTTGKIKKPPLVAKPSPQKFAARGAKKAARRKSRNAEKYYTPPESPTATPKEVPSENPETPAENTETNAENAETPAGETPPGDESSASPPSAEPSKTIEKSEEDASETIKLPSVSDLVRDSARAAEPIPYIFYVRAEPDIEIAIEHDDEEVIPADTACEIIVGDFKRLVFNLEDKPCKGGKPWI